MYTVHVPHLQAKEPNIFSQSFKTIFLTSIINLHFQLRYDKEMSHLII